MLSPSVGQHPSQSQTHPARGEASGPWSAYPVAKRRQLAIIGNSLRILEFALLVVPVRGMNGGTCIQPKPVVSPRLTCVAVNASGCREAKMAL